MEREKRQGVGQRKERKICQLCGLLKRIDERKNPESDAFYRQMRCFEQQTLQTREFLAVHTFNVFQQHHLNHLLYLWSDILKSHILAALVRLEE